MPVFWGSFLLDEELEEEEAPAWCRLCVNEWEKKKTERREGKRTGRRIPTQRRPLAGRFQSCHWTLEVGWMQPREQEKLRTKKRGEGFS